MTRIQRRQRPRPIQRARVRPPGGARNGTVEGCVTEQALDGLFTVTAEQQASVRQNPAQAASRMAKKVFGLLKGN